MATLNAAKEVLRWLGTIGLILLCPIWGPICFVIYQIDWRGMGRDIQRMHEDIWRG